MTASDASADEWSKLVVAGDKFILDQPDIPPAVWGEGDELAWAEGEALMICGPQGVGKSTLAQQVTLSRMGIGSREVLGYPVQQSSSPVLYLAMDRPRQIARSFARMVTDADRKRLHSRLIVWDSPLPFNPLVYPQGLAEMALELGAETVVIDSYKDLGVPLAQEEAGIAVNLMVQHLVSAEIQVLGLNHQRKGQNGTGVKPKKLDDVFGSVWITAGVGSVLLLWGTPGQSKVELTHLKQPMSSIGKLEIVHDAAAGHMRRLSDDTDLLSALLAVGDEGGAVNDLAVAVFGAADKASTQRIRRMLRALADEEVAEMVAMGRKGGPGGGGRSQRWRLVSS